MRAFPGPAWILASAALFAAAGPRPLHAATEETELASRLAEDAGALLDQLLGPGRAKVLITVEGERSQTRDHTNIETPMEKKEEGPAPMPGYSPSNLLDRTFRFIQRDQQEATRSSFIVNKLSVSLLIDQGVPESQAEAVRKVLADMLRLNVARGDSLVVVRAPLYPGWRRLLQSPDVFRTVVGQGILALGLLLAASMLYLAGVRGMRVLTETVLQRRGFEPPFLPTAGRPGDVTMIPPGGDDGPPSLTQLDEASDAAGTLPDSDRFGFLASQPQEELFGLLQAEPLEDVALLFVWLADRQPELGTLLFSILPGPYQVELSRAMVRVQRADPDRVALLESRLREQVESRVRGTDKLGRLLSGLAPEERELLLGDLSSTDAEASRKVQDALLTFEDLLGLKVEDLRRLVAAVPLDGWAVALRDAGPEMVGRVAEVLPGPVREVLRDGTEREQPREKILEARGKILTQALALAAQGQIALRSRMRN